MKLENISKVFGVLASISFVVVILAVLRIAIVTRRVYGAVDVASIFAASFLGITVVFLLAAILTTLKRIAHDIEGGKRSDE